VPTFGWRQRAVTSSLTCSYLAPAQLAADLVARAEVINSGKRVVYGEVFVRSREKVAAHATLTYLNVTRRS
jgi:acyl-coenzyme A thioesterase PaaI-like protein